MNIHPIHAFSWSPSIPSITKPRAISVGLRSHDAGNYRRRPGSESSHALLLFPCVFTTDPQWFDVERIRRENKFCPKSTGSVVAQELLSRGLTNRSLYGRGGSLVHGRWTTAKPIHLSPSSQVGPTPRPETSPLHLAPVVLIPSLLLILTPPNSF